MNKTSSDDMTDIPLKSFPFTPLHLPLKTYFSDWQIKKASLTQGGKT